MTTGLRLAAVKSALARNSTTSFSFAPPGRAWWPDCLPSCWSLECKKGTGNCHSTRRGCVKGSASSRSTTKPNRQRGSTCRRSDDVVLVLIDASLCSLCERSLHLLCDLAHVFVDRRRLDPLQPRDCCCSCHVRSRFTRNPLWRRIFKSHACRHSKAPRTRTRCCSSCGNAPRWSTSRRSSRYARHTSLPQSDAGGRDKPTCQPLIF